MIDLCAGGVHAKTSLTGATVGVDVSATEKIWKTFQSMGDIAFAYSYSNVLIEIQDTILSAHETACSASRTIVGNCTFIFIRVKYYRAIVHLSLFF